MNFRELAEILCKATELKVDDVLATGGCSIRFQDSFDVNIEWEEETSSLCLYTPLMKIPASHKEQLYARLLSTHVFGAATQGALFGIYPERNEVMLFKKISAANLTEIDCLNALQQFVQQATFWLLQLNSHIATA
jgi:hypothetical protein